MLIPNTTNKVSIILESSGADAIVELLWNSLKRVPNHPDRRQTGVGSKTKQGLIASILRAIVENSKIER